MEKIIVFGMMIVIVAACVTGVAAAHDMNDGRVLTVVTQLVHGGGAQ